MGRRGTYTQQEKKDTGKSMDFRTGKLYSPVDTSKAVNGKGVVNEKEKGGRS